VDFLTENKKYLNYTDKDGESTLGTAISSLALDIFKLLKSKAEKYDIQLEAKKISADTFKGNKVFYDNCVLGNFEIIKSLLNKGFDVNKDTNGNSPLKAAVLSGNTDLVRLLIEQGADIHKPLNPSGTTILHQAAQSGIAEVIQVLVEAGHNINAVDTKGNSPLYVAVLSKQIDSVHELLRLGADPNIRPEKRPAAVWMAVVQDERESIQSLIQYGAECELDSTLAMQLMDYALAFDIPEIVSISLEQCLTADFSFRGDVPGIWVADYYDAIHSKEVLLNAGAEPDAKPNWNFKQADESFNQLLSLESFLVVYPPQLRKKYGELKVNIEVVIDRIGKVRFPKFLEPIPWDLRLFIRESIRGWAVELPNDSDLNTAYRLRIPLVLKAPEYEIKVFEISELEKAPVPIERVAPIYPRELKSNRVQGKVDVVFVLDESGIPTDISIEFSTDARFSDSAITAVKQWKFQPGFKDGRAVKTCIRLPLAFSLRQ